MERFGLFDMLVVAAYLAGVAVLGIIQVVRIKSSGDYFTGGRRFNKFLMVMHALGTGTHADDPVGVTGAVYQRGLSGIWYTYVYLFITPFYWIIAPFFRRSRYITTADFFEARFSPRLGTLYTIMGIIVFAVNTGTLLKGAGTITTAVTSGAVPEWVAIVGMTAIFVAYGLAGGLAATIVTEGVQGLLIVVMSLLLVPFGLRVIGGATGLHQLVPAGMFSLAAPEEMTITWILVASLMGLIGIVAQPHTMEVCSTGKTEFEGRVGFTYGNFVKRFCAMGWAFTGLIVIAMVAGGQTPGLAGREQAFGAAIRDLLPAGATGLMFAAVLAAQMSTLSAFMVAGSALIARNLYLRHLAPQASDRQVLLMGRFAGLIVVGAGLLFSFFVQSVAQALTIFWGLNTLTGILIWFGMLWRRANPAGAWASFLAMSVPWLLLGAFGVVLKGMLPQVEWLGAFAQPKFLPQLVATYLPLGVVAMIAGSLLGRPVDKGRLDRFYLLLGTPVGREERLRQAGVDVVYAGATDGHPWELNHPKAVNVVGFIVALMFAASILALVWAFARIGA